MAANAAVVLTLHDQNNIVAENKLKEEEAIAAIKKASKDTPPSQRVAYFSLLRYIFLKSVFSIRRRRSSHRPPLLLLTFSLFFLAVTDMQTGWTSCT